MRIEHIATFAAVSPVFLIPLLRHLRQWFIFIGSIIAIYWLQPTLNIRWLDYSLPTVILFVTVICWLISNPRLKASSTSVLQPEDRTALVILVAIVMILTTSRYVTLPFDITSHPPETPHVVIILSVVAIIVFSLLSVLHTRSRLLVWGGLIILMALLVLTKTEPLAKEFSILLRHQSGQDVALASAIDIQWLGFSYVAFRLIHTLRDAMSGILPATTLREYVSYVIFFPAFSAGPIDRIERFVGDYRILNDLKPDEANTFATGIARLTTGLFKKFVVADSLSILSLSVTSASQANSTPALWLMLYAYTFQIYFDFSSYTDIAIGIGLLLGIQLPENFSEPYRKNSITAFWQSWHITLSNWVRFYIYSPLSRSLIRRQKLSNNTIIFVCTLATMLIIGLWHGITMSFFIWGLWHGLGLFMHKVWSDRTRKLYRHLGDHPYPKSLWHIAGWFLTFHFVALGWVWFAMPDLDSALMILRRLFGL